METPQCFRLRLLEESYRQVAAEQLTVTDEVSALQHLGHAIMLIANPSPNIKVTFPSDLALAETLLSV